jgi:hypothetical protein
MYRSRQDGCQVLKKGLEEKEACAADGDGNVALLAAAAFPGVGLVSFCSDEAAPGLVAGVQGRL